MRPKPHPPRPGLPIPPPPGLPRPANRSLLRSPLGVRQRLVSDGFLILIEYRVELTGGFMDFFHGRQAIANGFHLLADLQHGVLADGAIGLKLHLVGHQGTDPVLIGIPQRELGRHQLQGFCGFLQLCLQVVDHHRTAAALNASPWVGLLPLRCGYPSGRKL